MNTDTIKERSDNTEKDILKSPLSVAEAAADPRIRFRKIRSRLGISAFGVMAFAVWSIIRTILQMFFGTTPTLNEVNNGVAAQTIEAQVDDSVIVLILVVVLTVLAVEIALRLFIGLSARAESKGKKKSIVYIILAGLFIPFYVTIIIYSFQNSNYLESNVFDNIISIILDITSLISFIELFVSAIMLRRMRKKYVDIEQKG